MQNAANWNFIKQDKKFLDFYEKYKKNSDNISIYYDHITAEHYFGDRFYFDIGFILNKNRIKTKPENNYEILNFKNFTGYSQFIPTEYYPKDKKLIKLTQNSQGYSILDKRYKIIWSVKNPDQFYFTNHQIIFNMGQSSIICSNNKKEVLYLFSLLNFPATKLLLEANLKNENEKEYLVPVKTIKEFIHIPKITGDNQFIKNEIIKQTEKMLRLEEIKLNDLVDFSKVMMQKFDDAKVEKNNLVLVKDNKEIKLKIKNNPSLIKKALNNLIDSDKLKLEKGVINLNELKELPIIDFELRDKIKNYIDDLVFALYFNVSLENLGLGNARGIKKECLKNVYYGVVNKKS